eukprot:GILJ01011322.1.p1 GENE.GILJ01011322.1~~GILJ01011322.1.p1  ORF type:complete len:352 (+),score=33.59 GILJ01011322.1:94-1056(+)
MVFKFCESRAALRGAKGEPMHPLVHRALALFFILVMTGPLCYFLPYISIPALLLYLPSYLDRSELSGGRFSEAVRSSRWFVKFRDYFPISLVKTVDLDPTKLYMFGIHPHGILPFAGVGNFGSEMNNISQLFPGVKLRGLAASFCFYMPGYRDMLLAQGVCDAARYSASKLLRQGTSVFVVPGGATEALYSTPKEDVLFLKNRHGFIRLALQHGASLVPVFSFGENDTFHQLGFNHPWIQQAKLKFQRIFGISLPLITNIIPRKTPITTVVGSPIPVEQVDQPTKEQVEQLLQTYIDAVTALYNQHKAKYNKTEKSLTIL